MKRKSIIALAILAIGSMSAFAQSPCARQCCKQDSCQQQVCNNENRRMTPRNVQPRRMNYFNGIELTTEQRTALDSIRLGREDQRQVMNQSRRDYINAVKEVLTPEQYVVFLENIATMPQQRPNRQGHPQPRRQHQPQK